jgi:hypothetical protein
MLQHKTTSQIQEIENHIKNEEISKQKTLEEALQNDPESTQKQTRGKKKA